MKNSQRKSPPYKNKGFGYVAHLLAVASVVSSASIANAATFNFSFSNVGGNTPGTVEGTIELPDGDFFGQAATSVIVTSAPAALGYTTPVDILSNLVQNFANSFNVVGGQIDDANSQLAVSFNVGTPSNSVFSLNFPGFGSLSLLGVNGVPDIDGNNGVVDASNTTLVFSSNAATTPEPSSLLGLLAVGSIGALVRKRQI